MKYTSVSELIKAIDQSFIDVVKDYRLACIRNEFYGDDFKDSEVDIFISNRYPYLMKLIDDYREIKDTPYSCEYTDAIEKINELKRNAHDFRITIDRRRRQVKDSERNALTSISFFLSELYDRLQFEIDIITKCLNPFSEYVNELNDNGMTINEDPDYILYYINKCVILSHTNFFKDDCVNGLINLNKRVIETTAYKSEMLFRLGTLDFNFHFYDEAKIILKRAIEQIEMEIKEQDDDEKRYMLFSSYLMYVTSYEFSGDYIGALSILFGLEPDNKTKTGIIDIDDIIKTFENALSQRGCSLKDLLFSTTNENEKRAVIALLNDIFVTNIFKGRMAEFAYKNGYVFRKLIEKGNASFEEELEFVKDNGFDNDRHTPSQADIIRVHEHFNQCVEDNKPMHDYLHILSHCLNEEATAILANDKVGYNGKACDLMIIARALMLYVSENQAYYKNASLYKTCYATVFAEAGDFSIANASLQEFQKKAYSNLGVDSKAEINFYYYLISRIDSINNGKATYVDDENDESYIRFLNCCYRNFDFDAIAHMSLLSVEYYIATILQQHNLADLKRIVRDDKFFTDRIKNKIKGIGKSGHNIWLSNERRKVNYMYQFLRLFLSTSDKKFARTPQIYEIASKYLYYSNINTIVESERSERIPYIDYTDEINLKNSMESILDNYSYYEKKGSEYNYLSAGNCVFVSLKKYDDECYKKLGEEINSNQGLFFVHADVHRSQEIKEKLSYICNGEEMRIRFFNDDIGALREFFLFCVFERIKNDFVSPNGLFVMTPVHNAEPCKYQVTDFGNLLSEVYEKIGLSQFDEEEVDSQAQYEPSGVNRRVLSKGWIRRLEPHKEKIIWAAMLMKKQNSYESRYIYSFCFRGDELKTAVLLNPKECYESLGLLWTNKPVLHQNKCNSTTARCKNNLFDINATGKTGKRLQTLFLSMPELQWKKTQEEYPNGTLIIWKHVSVPYTIWRLVVVDVEKNVLKKDSDKNSIPTIICNKGNDEPFQTTRINNVDNWPVPYDISKNDRFVFISHLATASDIIKKELNECLEENNVRYWYDSELIVTEIWKEKIGGIIDSPNCVGAILFITDGMFFKSESIGFELEKFKKKKDRTQDFKVIPIVYNCRSEKDLEESYQLGYNNIYDREEVRKLLGIGNKDRKKIFLNTWNGENLSEYLEREKNSEGKREGALVSALSSLGVLA